MNRVETKKWAKEKIKGHIWELLIPIMVAGILTSLTIGGSYDAEAGKFSAGYNVGIFFSFVEVGLAFYMIKFIKDQKAEFKDLFYFTKDYIRIFITNLLKGVFIFLWALLLVVPGIIKAFAYSLTALILADDKYADLSYTGVLKKSEEMMKGHKMDLFVFGLSFIGWHMLAIFTLGLLEIWIIPYYTTANYKFLNDIKEDYENKNGMNNSGKIETENVPNNSENAQAA